MYLCKIKSSKRPPTLSRATTCKPHCSLISGRRICCRWHVQKLAPFPQTPLAAFRWSRTLAVSHKKCKLQKLVIQRKKRTARRWTRPIGTLRQMISGWVGGPLRAPLPTAAPPPRGRLRAPGATDRKITRVGFDGGERAGVSNTLYIARNFGMECLIAQQHKQITCAVHKVPERMRFRVGGMKDLQKARLTKKNCRVWGGSLYSDNTKSLKK